MIYIYLFFILLFGHCLADTGLQSDVMAKRKNRNRPVDINSIPPGQRHLKLWWMWLTHHAVIHGGIVWILTGRVYLGIIETITHWIIDFYKCENKYNPYIDQALHLSIKVIYCLIILGGI